MSQLNPLAFSVLEKFAQVTRSLDRAKDAIVNSPYTQSLLPYTTGIANQETEATYGPNFTTQFNHLQGLDVTARLYLSRWAASMVENPSLNGAFSTNSSRHNISLQENLSTEVGDFEILEDLGVAPYDRFICCSKEPLSATEWVRYFYQQSDPYSSDAPKYSSQLLIPDYLIRKRIFSGGIEHDIRPEVWKYLLNVYPWDSTEDERNEIRIRNNDNYFKLKQIWLDPKIQQTEDYQEQKSRIEKDVLRTDRHVPLFAERQIPNGGPANEEDSALPHSNEHLEQLKDILMCYHYYQKGLGYVQGMSDLLSPLYMTIQDEVETFNCFVGLMERTKANFARDQKGMHLQLTTLNLLVKLLIPKLYSHLQSIDSDNMFCCYRWLLIQFKREFNFETIMRVWELFWCDYLTRHHHIFLALAILDIHHHIIIEHLQGLDEVLKYINDLSDKIDYTSAFKRSEVLFRQFQWRMNAHPNLTLEELDPNVYSPGFPRFMTYRNEPLHLDQEELNSLKYLLDSPAASTPTPTDSFIDIQDSNSFHE